MPVLDSFAEVRGIKVIVGKFLYSGQRLSNAQNRSSSALLLNVHAATLRPY